MPAGNRVFSKRGLSLANRKHFHYKTADFNLQELPEKLKWETHNVFTAEG